MKQKQQHLGIFQASSQLMLVNLGHRYAEVLSAKVLSAEVLSAKLRYLVFILWAIVKH